MGNYLHLQVHVHSHVLSSPLLDRLGICFFDRSLFDLPWSFFSSRSGSVGVGFIIFYLSKVGLLVHDTELLWTISYLSACAKAQKQLHITQVLVLSRVRKKKLQILPMSMHNLNFLTPEQANA